MTERQENTPFCDTSFLTNFLRKIHQLLHFYLTPTTGWSFTLLFPQQKSLKIRDPSCLLNSESLCEEIMEKKMEGKSGVYPKSQVRQRPGSPHKHVQPKGYANPSQSNLNSKHHLLSNKTHPSILSNFIQTKKSIFQNT